jgi:hypothetical protein
MATKKYRPYLTLAELELLVSVLEEISLKNTDTRALRKYLQKYISDIKSGYRAENHTLKPGIEERLGFSNSHSSEPSADEITAAEIDLRKCFADFEQKLLKG